MNKKKDKERGKVALPSDRLKTEAQLSILKSLVEWHDKNKKPVTYKDIGGVDAGKTSVSLTFGYFSDVGWLQQKGRGEYVPSEELVQYFMGFNRESGAHKLASKILSSRLGQRLHFFLEQKGKASEEDIISNIGSHLDLKQKDYRRIKRVIDLLLKLGMLEKTEEGITLKKDQKKSPLQPRRKGEQEPREKVTKERDMKREKVQPGVILGIFIDANAPEEKIRKNVRIAMEEIKKEVSNGE